MGCAKQAVPAGAGSGRSCSWLSERGDVPRLWANSPEGPIQFGIESSTALSGEWLCRSGRGTIRHRVPRAESAVSEPRLFIAVPIEPTPRLQEITDSLRCLGRGVRCTRLDQSHVTLKFLGPTPGQVVPQILKALDACARTERSSGVRLHSLGVFPTEERPRVLWAGIRPVEALQRMAAELDARLAATGFVPETRSFTPHLTLARFTGPPPRELPMWLDSHRQTDFGEARMTRLVLYRSDLGNAGSTYVPLGSSSLLD